MNYIAHRFSSHQYHVGFFLLAFLLASNAHAQFYESGTEPASVKWQQIHTEHFRIIFPTDAFQDGQRAANALEYIYLAGGKSLNHAPAKIPVVLHNRTAFSNGFVSWAPKRSEWFLTPPQDNYAQDWLHQLSVHEYRHVVQVDKLNQGITRTLGFAVGQQAVGAAAGLLPLWFLEGDAVATETALTNTGRGRNPAFEMPLRTIALSGKYQKHDKAFFGSYRDHVPNYYELGYQMVGWTRQHYGAKTFETSVDFVAHHPYTLIFCPPFRLGIKKETGYYTGELYRNAFEDLTFRWREQEIRTGYDNIAPLTKRSTNLYTNYRSPQYLNDSVFVALKTGMAQIAQWVKVDRDGREQILHTPGFINSERVSYSNGLLAWTEQIQDVRWSNRSYSVVKLFNIYTGMEGMLDCRTRYYSPTLSPDGATIAVVDVPVDGVCSIVLLELTGKVKERLPNPNGSFLQTPSWTRDGKNLLVIVNDSKGKSIVQIDIATGQYTTILPYAYDDISYPVDGGKYAFFTGYYNGITNVYAVDYRTEKVMQVTSSRFGAFDPQPNASNDKLVYAEYSVNGYNLVEKYMDTAKWTPVDQLTDHSLKLYETLALQEGFNMQDSVIPNVQHQVKPYRKWTNLFNVHSWAPLYYEVDVSDVTSTELYPGAVLFSQDLLGNLTSSAGYSWQGYHALHAGFTYKGLYPIIDFKIEHGGKVAVLGAPQNGVDENFKPQSLHTRINMRSYIPFTFTRNRWITGVVPQIRLTFNNHYLYSPTTKNYQHGLWEMGYSLQTYRYLKMSVRDLSPRLGFLAQGAFVHMPWNEQLGYIYYIYGRAYLPGIANHHSLRLSGAWQQQKVKDYILSSLLMFPRGYALGRTEKLRIGTVDYSMPLFYPDWSLSKLVYLKRLRTNLFCDIAQNEYRLKEDNIVKNLLSVGVDLLADVNLIQIYFPISMGVRIAYVPKTEMISPSLLFSVSFN